MPNITRLVGLHNQVPEANTDKVWAGMVLRLDNGQYQFLALFGPRLGPKREAFQAATSSFRASQKFDQMLRDKRAHGYTVIDFTEPRYNLLRAVERQGNLSSAQVIMPTGVRQGVPPPPRTVTVTPVERATAAVEHMAPRAPEPAPPAPSVEQLTEYIQRRTGAPAPEQPKPEQPPIRKARRLDF